MENLKLKLFNFKKELTLDQEDVSKIVEGYINNFTEYSEKEVITMLSEQLSVYTFDNKVKTLVEGLSTDLSENELLLDLKHLYKKIERKNQGQIHRHTLQVLLNIINESDESLRMQKIVNELSLYDWIYEVKSFMYQFSSTPVEKENLKNGGSVEPVFTVVEKVEAGTVVFVKDKWFLLSEKNLAFCNLEDHVKDTVKLKQLRILEQALETATITKDRISFDVSSDLTIGIDSKNGKKIYLNNDLLEESQDLETVFNSPLVSFMHSSFYPIIKETSNNIKKFVEFDIAMKVSNVLNMFAESFVFNYKDKIYNYTCDKRYGNSLYEYESVSELINEVRSNYDFDVTYFYQNKLSDEVKAKRKLEDREKEITLYLDEVNENVQVLHNQIKVMEGNDLLENALNKLLVEKANKEKELLVIKKEKHNITKEKSVVKTNEEAANELFGGGAIKKAEKKFWDKYKQELVNLEKAEKEGGDKLKEVQKDLKSKLKQDWKELGDGLKSDQKNVLRKSIETTIFNVDADDRRSMIQKIASGAGAGRTNKVNEGVEETTMTEFFKDICKQAMALESEQALRYLRPRLKHLKSISESAEIEEIKAINEFKVFNNYIDNLNPDEVNDEENDDNVEEFVKTMPKFVKDVNENVTPEQEVKDCIGADVDLDAFADYHGIKKQHAHVYLCNLADEEVKADIAKGDFSSFDEMDKTQFNDSYADMMDHILNMNRK